MITVTANDAGNRGQTLIVSGFVTAQSHGSKDGAGAKLSRFQSSVFTRVVP
jgi:hypothetical protein